MSDLVEKISHRELLRSIELLRNLFAPSEVVQYTVALLFLRWMTEHRIVTDYGIVSAKLCPKMSRSNCVEISLPPAVQSIRDVDTEDIRDFGNRINSIFQALELSNSSELKGVFADLNFSNGKFSNSENSSNLLRALVDHVWSLDFENRGGQATANSLAYYLNIATDPFISGLYSPEFNTPRSICTLVAKLMIPSQGDKVYDPACGTGKLLLALASEAEAANEKVFLAGTEINHSAWSLAKLNVLSNGYSSHAIAHGDSLMAAGVPNSDGEQLKFDVVVAHPPWSMKWKAEFAPNDRYNRFARGTPPSGNADYAFILHMVSSMREYSGRMAVVVSNGVLSRSGREAEIRESLITDNLVHAVIALPDKLFKGTSIAGSILILKKGRSISDVRFIDARSIADLGRSQNSLSESAIQLLADIYHSREERNDLSALISRREIIGNNYSLQVPLYVRTIREEDDAPIEEIRAQRLTIQREVDNITEIIDHELHLLARN